MVIKGSVMKFFNEKRNRRNLQMLVIGLFAGYWVFFFAATAIRQGWRVRVARGRCIGGVGRCGIEEIRNRATCVVYMYVDIDIHIDI